MRENPGEDTILEAKDLTMEFQPKGAKSVCALTGISFSAYAGKVTGLVGPDGAGKTTFLRLAAGLLMPAAGNLKVLGLDVVRDIDKLRSRIGYMPQQFGLYEDLTVAENLTFYADLKSVPLNERPERIKKLLEITDLAKFNDRRAGRLSGGMKQKLGLACCLIKAPEILILDEPTVGVDPVSRRDLWAIVDELVREDGIGVVVATSYLDEADRCDKVILLHQGEIVDIGPPSHFIEGLEKRVFIATDIDAIGSRELQRKLYLYPEVIDATIRSGKVRIVVKNVSSSEMLLADPPVGVDISRATPVFEDGFMDKMVERLGNQRLVMSPVGEVARGKSENAEVVVSVSGLTKKFGDFTAVENIGFQVRRGDIFGLLGSNGAGKTTTFRMLCGLLPATDGEIDVAGHNLRTSSATARSRLGYMAQKFSLYRQLSVLQNLKFYGKAYGLSGKKLKERLDWALQEFDLTAKAKDQAETLPGGYRQRLAMAVAMVHEPDILFLDEPTSGADPLARREFWLRINGFAREGVTIVVTTHFMEEAEFCDHMVIMSQGKNLAAGRPDQIRKMAVTPSNPDPTVEDAFIALTDTNSLVDGGKTNV
ncbi:MAG: ATP-binding cassette domain-containing protein [Desulfotalea sp.]